MVNIPLESGYGLPAAYVAGLRASPDFVPQRYAHFVPSPTSPDRMSLMGTVLPGYGQGHLLSYHLVPNVSVESLTSIAIKI
ncbi:uncharacterized protein EAE97_003726 [Botrytis byssoidea]|uniref:Uncharacterized protein n=1 Tax=Botrytis byssoidea TaxID=139641 RepID=A0A9P5M4E7_9HELO|nr:uncharacterized protein EAE97_003726 [Botrytis byssoidea]KAF7948315.1 hypothetical protein EAE97_003726 [Botrytis byssoidea]